jgi:hypothetical protein
MANTIDFNVSTNAVNVLNQTADAADNTAKGFTSAKAELRALQNQLQQMDKTSEEFKIASARAAELKDNISDLSAEISANAGNAFEGISNNVGLFSSRLMDLDLKGAGQALSGMGTAVRNIDFKTLKDEVGGLIKGLADLGKAILANPILLLGVAIAGVIANWKEFAALFKGETAVLNSLKKELGALEAQNAAIKNKITYSKMYGDSLYQQYLLSQELLGNEIKQEQTKKRIAEIQDDSKASEEARKRIIELQNQALLEQNQHIVDYYKTISDANLIGNDSAKIEDEKRRATEKYNTALEETRAKLIQLRADRKLSLSGVGNAFDIQVYEDNEKKLLDAIDKTNKSIDKRESDARKEIAQKEIDDYEKSQQELTDILTKWEEEADEAEMARRKKLNDEMIAEDERMASISINDLIERGDAQLATEMQIHANLTSLRAQQSQQEIEELRQAEDAKAQLRVDAMKTSLSIISDLAGAFAGESEAQQRKAFQIQKGVSIATATIDTYLAAQGAYRSQMAISTPDAPVRAAVAAGIAIAQGLARVAVISKQQFNGGGSTSGGSGGGSVPSAGGMQAPSPSNFAFVQNQPNQQPPLQAYVVSTQVSSNLEAQQLINNQARLGG